MCWIPGVWRLRIGTTEVQISAFRLNVIYSTYCAKAMGMTDEGVTVEMLARALKLDEICRIGLETV